MKKYDRETKKYITEEEYNRKYGKRKLCKGGREHDYILTLPPYIRTEHNILGIDVAEQYYKIELEIDKLIAEKHKELEALGILHRPYGRITDRQYKYYICSVCGKRESK